MLTPLLLALSLTSVLRAGPVQPVSVPPGEQTTVYLQRFVVNTADDPKLVIRLVDAGGVPVEVQEEARAVVVGPVANLALPGNLGSIQVELENANGEKARLQIPIVVAASSTPEVTFTYRATGPVRTVVAAGEFNNWSQTANPLSDPDGDGTWTAKARVAAGRYTYKLVVDGQWMADPSNANRSPDGFGGENTVLVVGGGSESLRLVGRALLPGERAELDVVTASGAPATGPGGSVTVLALAGGERLPVRLEGSRATITLPGDGDPYVQVLAADAAGVVTRPFSFHAGRRSFRWEDAVLYFAFIDRFANGDVDNDRPLRDEGILPPANYFGGDLAGLRQKIDEGYFTNLGVNAIWLSPFLRNPDRAYRDALPPHRLFSGYHGYWPISDTEVDPRFGSFDELKAVVDAAHARGIKVLFDMVYNHVHEDHPAARQHPEWIIPVDLPDGRRNIRLFDEHPLTTWFDDFLPDINYGARAAAEWQVARSVEMVRATGVDGFRLDAVKHVPHPFWGMLRRALAPIEAERGERFYLVGESIDSRKKINEFVAPSMLDGQFDFPLHWAVRGALAQENDGYDRLESELTRGEREYWDDSIHSTLLGNHDFSRFMAYAENAFAGGRDEKEVGWTDPPQVKDPASYERLKRAFTFLYAIRGIPLVYYGDEVGMTGAHDPDNRRPMPWGDQVDADQRSVFQHVARLGAVRAAHPALRYGSRRPLIAERERLAFLRQHFEDAVVACWNRGAASRGGESVFRMAVGPDLVDDVTLVDALGSGVRGTVKDGVLEVTVPAGKSVLLVVERR